MEEPTPVVPTALAQLSDGSYLAVSGAGSEEFSSTGVLQSTVTPETLVACNPSSRILRGDCFPAQRRLC